jgi:hypothetical protein
MLFSTLKSKESIIAQGWILMFLLFLGMLVMEFLTAVVSGDLTAFTSAEGQTGMKIMIFLMLLHALVPMLVVSFKAVWFRWFIAVLTMFFGLFMVMHEVSHLFIVSNRTFGVRDALDFAHHGLAIWVALVAVAWARQTKTNQA